MPLLDPEQLEGLTHPELIFGLVAAVGTPLDLVQNLLAQGLTERGYSCELVHLSKFLDAITLPGKTSTEASDDYERINILMDRGTALRRRAGGGEALALLAASHINRQRPVEPPRHMARKAFVIRQLKHPDEVWWLRRIYGPAFHLVGVYCPRITRHRTLEASGLTAKQSSTLIDRDEGEEELLGQQLVRTFHFADVFLEYRSRDEGSDRLTRQVSRFVKLLFGEGIETPSRDEYGMRLAHTAALRSSDLSRQVGAAVLSPAGELLAVGTNEVPCSGGGQYWGGDGDERDFRRGFDANSQVQRDCLTEVVASIATGWDGLDEAARMKLVNEHARRLANARLMNLTEFGRAVHAEMEAIIAAGRIGAAVRGGCLYTTTFPCHNCAKHIVDAGISRVVYVEPYAKSLARQLHNDAITFPEDTPAHEERRVLFEPFVGIAPRTFDNLFSMVSSEGKRLPRKGDDGRVTDQPWGLRVRSSPLSYIDRENIAALAAQRIGEIGAEEVTDGGA